MKVLIWIGCALLFAIARFIISSMVSLIPVTDDGSVLLIGLLSGVLTAVAAGLSIWLAKILCKKV